MQLLTGILASRFITLYQAPVIGDVVPPDRTEACDIVAPVAVKLSSNSGPVKQLAASCSHPLMGSLSCVLSKGPRSIGDNEDIKALFDQGERGESNADLGQNATVMYANPLVFLSVCSSAGDLPDNHLLLARLLHGIRKVFVVHGIDLARSTDNRSIRNLIRNLLHDRAVGASLKRGRENGRGFVVVGDFGQGDDIVVELVGFEITNQLDETGLLKQNQSVMRSSYHHLRAEMIGLPGDPQTERRSCPCRDACKPEAFWQ